MVIIKKKGKPRTIRKLNNFSIGRGKDKIDFKNVKRIDTHSKGLGVFYEVDVYKKKKLLYKKVSYGVDNKKELQKFLKVLYPKGTRLVV